MIYNIGAHGGGAVSRVRHWGRSRRNSEFGTSIRQASEGCAMKSVTRSIGELNRKERQAA